MKKKKIKKRYLFLTRKFFGKNKEEF